MTKTVEVTIEVPIGDIEIVNSNVSHEPESRHHPEGFDVTYDCIVIDKLPDEYKIVEHQDNVIDNHLINQWRNDQ